MKRYFTIGRDLQSDIVLNDDTDIVSRRHAILEVGRNGKYFITDESQNGTYVNGIRITSNEKVPIVRDDEVSFAHVADLDWSLVPVDRTALYSVLGVLGGVVAAVLIALVTIWAVDNGKEDSGVPCGTVENVSAVPEIVGPSSSTNPPAVVDGDKKATEEKEKAAPKPTVKPSKKADKKKEEEKPVVIPDAIY